MPTLQQPPVAMDATPQGPFGGLQTAMTNESLDMPAALQGLFQTGAPAPSIDTTGFGPQGMGMSAQAPQNSFAGLGQSNSFATGGMIGAQGAQIPSGALPNGAVPGGAPGQVGLAPQGQGAQPAQISERDVQQFMEQHPQQVQQIAMRIGQMVAAGTVSQQQLDMAEQLALVALQNPALYPQLRQYAIQQGLAEEQDVPQQYDQALLFSVILAARAVRSGSQGGAPTGEMPPTPQNLARGGAVLPNANAARGGAVHGPGTATSDSVPINASVGEYVIPAHVVQMKGKEFFDSLLEKYKQ